MKKLLFTCLFVFPFIFSKGQTNPSRKIDSLQQELSKAKDDTNKVNILYELAKRYSRQDVLKGQEYGHRSLAVARQINWQSGIAKSCLGLAWGYRFKSDYALALAYCDTALTTWKKLNDKHGIASIYQLMGVLYIDLSDYSQALAYELQALKISEELDDKRLTGGNLINIGIIYEDMGEHAKAMEYHTRALKNFEAINDKHTIAVSLSNIGLVAKEQGDYTKALDVLFRALKIQEELGSTSQIASDYGYIGDTYKAMGDYDKALEYQLKAEQLSAASGSKGGHAEKLQNIGNIYIAMAQKGMDKNLSLEKAADYFTRAADLHQQIGNVKDLSENYRDRSTAHYLMGNYKEALADHQFYMTYKDSFNNTVKNKQLKELETRYETKEKDKQIAAQQKQIAYNRVVNSSLVAGSGLLMAIGVIVYVNQRKTRRLNRQITSQKKELEQLNGVKDRIFSIISHDLRTPVNSLVSFTQLLESGDIPPEKLQAYAAILKNNLSHTASLMENLLNWARTQMQGYKPVPETFDLAEIAKSTVGLLVAEAKSKNIGLANEIPEHTYVQADMNMTALIIRNLISNAIKYTHKNGTITLGARPQHNKILLTVTDTGTGIAADMVREFNQSNSEQPLESTPGTNKEKGTGLGLMLCKGFASLMQGRITLASEPGKGSSFTVELPAAAT